MTDEAIISAFSDGVRDIIMKEELAIHEELCMTLELFNIATKCARAEEGRLLLLYRYLLHYGLLLHIMSQYLCLFSLIL